MVISRPSRDYTRSPKPKRHYRKVVHSRSKIRINPESVAALTKKSLKQQKENERKDRERKERLRKEEKAETDRRAAQRGQAGRDPDFFESPPNLAYGGGGYEMPTILEGLVVSLLFVSIFYFLFLILPITVQWMNRKY